MKTKFTVNYLLVYLQAAPELLVPIEEVPEDVYLQAPGQLSDADDEEPWIPDPHKPKAARSLNFDPHVTTDVQMAHIPAPAGTREAAAGVPTEQNGPNRAVGGSVQTGRGKPSENHHLHDKQAVPSLEDPAIDGQLQPQRELHALRTRESAVLSRTPASAQRQKKQTPQQVKGPELGREGVTGAKSPHRDAVAEGQGVKAAKESHAGGGKPQQATRGMHRTAHTPGARTRMAGQVKQVNSVASMYLFHATRLATTVCQWLRTGLLLSLCMIHGCLPQDKFLRKEDNMGLPCRSRVLPQGERLQRQCLELTKLWRGARRVDKPLQMRR